MTVGGRFVIARSRRRQRRRLVNSGHVRRVGSRAADSFDIVIDSAASYTLASRAAGPPDPLNSRHSIFTPFPASPHPTTPRPVPTRPPTFTVIPITVSTLPGQVDREPPTSLLRPTVSETDVGMHERGRRRVYFSRQRQVVCVVRNRLRQSQCDLASCRKSVFLLFLCVIMHNFMCFVKNGLSLAVF